jgi:spermidine/putrescine transport system substrate-binding protein
MDHRAFTRTITRRESLRAAVVGLTAVGAGPALLAACGGDDDAQGGGEGVGGNIDFISWEGYDLLDQTRDWQRENSVRLRSTYIGASDDVIAKVKSGGLDYDLTTFNVTQPVEWHELGLLTELDEAQIPNLEKLYPFFRTGESADEFWRRDGKLYGVPFTWGSISSNYRPDEVDPPTSWQDLFEAPYAGKVGCVDDYTVFTLTGRILGFDPPNYTPEQFRECASFLRRIVKLGPGVAPSYGDLTNQLVSGDVHATFLGWSALDIFAQDKGVEVKSVVPSEGSFSFCDAYAIPPTSDNRETTLAFINEALTPEVQSAQAEALSAGAVNPAAVPLIKGPAKGLYDYTRLKEIFALSPLYTGPPTKPTGNIASKDDWTEEWDKIKAGR